MSHRATTFFSLIALLTACIYSLVFFIHQSLYLSVFPFSLDYGEGIIWQQALDIFTPNAYGPIDQFPAIVFHYTPIYHSVAITLATLCNSDVLLTGRLISICSTLLIALIIALITNRATPPNTPPIYRIIICTSSGLLILSAYPIITWSQLMRVDMLALLFTITGFWLGLKSLEKCKWIYLAALFFVLAVFTKQNSIFAPLSLFSLLLWLYPRLALKGIATCLFLGLLTLGVLLFTLGGKFLNHIFIYNINTFDLRRLSMLMEGLRAHLLFVLLSIITIITGLRKFFYYLNCRGTKSIREAILFDQSTITFLAIFIYFLFATVSLLLITKEGAGINYTMEWFLACILLLGIMLSDSVIPLNTANCMEIEESMRSFQLRSFTLPLLVALHVFLFTYQIKSKSILDNLPEEKNRLESLAHIIKNSKKPVISDEMVLLHRSGKSVMWESAIFAQLERAGLWNPQPLADRIRDGEFSMIITHGDRGDFIFDQRYTPTLADAIEKAYPSKEKVGVYVVHLPVNNKFSANK